jgi:hypothetical protein
VFCYLYFVLSDFYDLIRSYKVNFVIASFSQFFQLAAYQKIKINGRLQFSKAKGIWFAVSIVRICRNSNIQSSPSMLQEIISKRIPGSTTNNCRDSVVARIFKLELISTPTGTYIHIDESEYSFAQWFSPKTEKSRKSSIWAVWKRSVQTRRSLRVQVCVQVC